MMPLKAELFSAWKCVYLIIPLKLNIPSLTDLNIKIVISTAVERSLNYIIWFKDFYIALPIKIGELLRSLSNDDSII